MTALRSVLDGRSVKALDSLGLATVEDLLRHYPRRYEERGSLTDLAALRPGERVTVLARVGKVATRTLPQRAGDRAIAHAFAHQAARGTPNSREKLAAVTAAIVSTSVPRSSASSAATCTTWRGSFGFPRCGTGAR